MKTHYSANTPDVVSSATSATGKHGDTPAVVLNANGMPDNLIIYPSDFPIKVMGQAHDAFHDTIVELVTGHDPSFHPGRVEVRPSSRGNYTALTLTVTATSRDQLDNLYRALTSHPMVKYVL